MANDTAAMGPRPAKPQPIDKKAIVRAIDEMSSLEGRLVLFGISVEDWIRHLTWAESRRPKVR